MSSTPESQTGGLATRRVLLLGAGGLGSIAGLSLARAGVGHITIVDDDRVDLSNLHRQLLYDDAHAGMAKAPLAADRLEREAHAHGHRLNAVAREIRALPDSICDLIHGHDLVVEGADNFATKFMTADAASLCGVPAVQAGAVRWVGWALASRPGGPCMRCIFEDIPRDRPETCAEAGVVGPVVGVLGSLQAALAVRVLLGDRSAHDQLFAYNPRAEGLRALPAPRRAGCPLCAGEIRDMEMGRYAPPNCAA